MGEKEYLIKILMTLFCGTVIGIERQMNGKPVGIRTSILICTATMTFVYIAQLVDNSQSVRVLGQAITGVGFLGAGVIMAKEGLIMGVTSASVVWMLSAVGAGIGFGYYLVSVTAALITIGVLVGVELLETSFKSLRKGVHEKFKSNPHK